MPILVNTPCCWLFVCSHATFLFAVMQTTVVPRHSGSSRWQQALDLLMGIKARGLTPDVVSYSSAMSACDRAGEWQVNISRCLTAVPRTLVLLDCVLFCCFFSRPLLGGGWVLWLLLVSFDSAIRTVPGSTQYLHIPHCSYPTKNDLLLPPGLWV